MLNWEEGKQLGKLLREELKGTYDLGPLPVSDLRLMEGSVVFRKLAEAKKAGGGTTMGGKRGKATLYERSLSVAATTEEGTIEMEEEEEGEVVPDDENAYDDEGAESEEDEVEVEEEEEEEPEEEEMELDQGEK